MIKYGLHYDSFIHVCTVTIVPITLSCHLPTLTKPLPLLTSPPSFISSFFGDPLNEFSCHSPEENAPSALHPLTGLELQEEEEQRCPLLRRETHPEGILPEPFSFPSCFILPTTGFYVWHCVLFLA